jgi:tRNA wybutosine-synthesizing protein 3
VESWEELKLKALQRIYHDKEIGYLDPDIFDLLMAFFKREKTYTYSSCSGRITIIDGVYPWSRKGSTIVFKDHLKVEEKDLANTISKGQLYRLWLTVQGPIIHAYTKDEEEAWEVIRLARLVGFKHSGILTKNSKGVLVELKTGIKFVHLIREDERQEVSWEEIARLTRLSNEILQRGKEKMRELQKVIESSVSEDSVKLGKNPKGKTSANYETA